MVNCWKRMVTCSFDLNLCHMNNFISCVRRINGRPVQRSTTRCHVRSWHTSRGCNIKFFTYTHYKKYFKTFQIEAKISLIKKVHLFFHQTCWMAQITCQKMPKSYIKIYIFLPHELSVSSFFFLQKDTQTDRQTDRQTDWRKHTQTS